MRKAINLSKGMLEHYRAYFVRNANKFISRFELRMDLLDQAIIYKNEEYIFIGQVSEKQFILKKVSDNCFYFELGTEFINNFAIKAE